MSRHWVWLSLGTNLGQRQENLLQGMGFLLTQGLEFENCSGIYATEPVGVEAQPEFYNLVLKVSCDLEPLAILGLCQEAERRLKRQRLLRWGPRTLDVDVLLIDDLQLHLPDLEVPHPRMSQRAFVLGPMGAMEPSLLTHWRLPLLTQGIRLKITAEDVKMLLRQRGAIR